MAFDAHSFRQGLKSRTSDDLVGPPRKDTHQHFICLEQSLMECRSSTSTTGDMPEPCRVPGGVGGIRGWDAGIVGGVRWVENVDVSRTVEGTRSRNRGEVGSKFDTVGTRQFRRQPLGGLRYMPGRRVREWLLKTRNKGFEDAQNHIDGGPRRGCAKEIRGMRKPAAKDRKLRATQVPTADQLRLDDEFADVNSPPKIESLRFFNRMDKDRISCMTVLEWAGMRRRGTESAMKQRRAIGDSDLIRLIMMSTAIRRRNPWALISTNQGSSDSTE
ncbi:hypothetical protein C8R44DRAFT_753712 [Mycena epipterygia]|nr:hypothetical protein C8R44DRAFT_753712 [Mycena epipterygia]